MEFTWRLYIAVLRVLQCKKGHKNISFQLQYVNNTGHLYSENNSLSRLFMIFLEAHMAYIYIYIYI